MPGPFMLLRGGRKVDLSALTPADIDFRLVADTLSEVVRYNAALDLPCSVAQHTIIATMCAPEAARPYVLAHDLHEHILGDLTRPIADLLAFKADRIYGRLARQVVQSVIAETKRGLDEVVYSAAGLAFPAPEWAAKAVHDAENKAILVELAVFNGGVTGGPDGWPKEVLEGCIALRTLPRPMTAPDAADELYRLMQRYLPVFNPSIQAA